MKKIVLKPLWHRDKYHIAICFDFDEAIKFHLKKLKEVSWSQTHRTFYLESLLSDKNLK